MSRMDHLRLLYEVKRERELPEVPRWRWLAIKCMENELGMRLTKAARGICQYDCNNPVAYRSRYCEFHQEYERSKNRERWRREHPPLTPEQRSERARIAALARWHGEA